MLLKKCEEQLSSLKTDQATINKIRMKEKHNLETKLKLLKQDYEQEKKVHIETKAKMMEGVSKNDVSQSLEKLRQESEKLRSDYNNERESREDLESKIKVAEAEKLEMKLALEQEHHEKLEALKNDEKNALEGLKAEIRLLTSQLENVRKECDLKKKSCEDYEAKTKIFEAEKLEIKQALEKEHQEKLEALKIEHLKKDNEKEKTAHEQLKMKLMEVEAEMRQSCEKEHQLKLEELQNDYITAMGDQTTEIQVLRSQLDVVNKIHEEDKKAHQKLEIKLKELEGEHAMCEETRGLESFKPNNDSESSTEFQKISFTTSQVLGVSKEDLNVLLIGNTGCGKSATGNSILRRQGFKSVLSSMPVTTNISSEIYKFDNRVITVFDGPGFEDSSEETPVSEEYFIKAMKRAHAVHASGYHAFIIVFSAMRKADASDVHLIRLVKKYFGEDFLRRFCVIVMTGGDLLKDTLFSQWCSENTGSNEILLECGKAVLFDNKTKEQSRLEQQFKCLISFIDNLNQSDEELLTVTFPDSIAQAL